MCPKQCPGLADGHSCLKEKYLQPSTTQWAETRLISMAKGFQLQFERLLESEPLFPPTLPASGKRNQPCWGEQRHSAGTPGAWLLGFLPTPVPAPSNACPLSASPTPRPRISGNLSRRILINHLLQWSSVEMFGTLVGAFGNAAVSGGGGALAKDATDPGTWKNCPASCMTLTCPLHIPVGE